MWSDKQQNLTVFLRTLYSDISDFPLMFTYRLKAFENRINIYFSIGK